MDNNLKESGDSTGKSKISVPELSLPKGGGAIKGLGEKFQTDAFTGTGSFSIPVYTTPSRSFKPELSLDYDSGSGNGIFGLGFSLSIPYISRKTEKNIPVYDDSDIFILQGADDLTVSLIKKDDGTWVRDEKTVTDGAAVWIVTRYRPRTEGMFAKIELWRDPVSGDSFWKTVSKENVASVYGQSEDAKISDTADQTRIYRWLIEKSWDAKGNKILYQYKQENHDNVPDDVFNAGHNDTANRYIQSIKYGNFACSEEGGKTGEKYAFEVVFDYGEYNIDVNNPDQYTPVKAWDVREDPFSSYRPGFEIRTNRLCKNILMFHHFDQELGNKPVLVRAMRLDYSQTKAASFLVSVNETGFRRDAQGCAALKSKPPVELSYSQFNPARGGFKPLIVQNSSGIPGILGQSQYLPVDLLGDGIPGFLYSDDNTTMYWRPEGEGVYNRLAPQSAFPIERNIEHGQYSLQDLEGNGSLDFVVTTPQRGGFYRSNSDGSWSPYRSFASYPLDLTGPYKDIADLNGDGLAEVLVFEDDYIKYYPSLGEKGYGSPVRTEKEEQFPGAASNYEEEVVRFADMFGDGLAHRVRIRNGSVECWPNKGYGRFNKKVVLGNAPRYDGALDAERLFLADLDGSGTADIIYVYPDRADIFFNRSGNSFSDPVSIPLPGIYDELSRINFADVTGGGSACLIFTSVRNGTRHYFFDFAGGTKPYLLTQIKNNLGALTRITYRSSTSYYFEDMKSGAPWKTKLPFPVQVVSRIESIDAVSGSKTVELYKYHDGYYDGVEKEFRGFGFVEHWDAESFEEASGSSNGKSDVSKETREELYVPPVYTKSWYHTGAYIEAGVLSKQYEKEYYQKDGKAFRLPDSAFEPIPAEEDAENYRQAWRALKGRLLRSEIYAADQKPESDHPYTVEETNYRVKQYQPLQSKGYAVFYVHENEALTYDYERNPDDPRMQHSFTLEVDDYGNVLNSCTVYYPRRLPPAEPASANPADRIYDEQMQLKATAELDRFGNITTDDCWLIGVICEKMSLELGGLDLQGEAYFSFDRIKVQLNEALNHRIRYDEDFSQGSKQSRPFTWERYYYWDLELDAALPLGAVNALALPHHIEQAVFTPQLIDNVFGGKVSEEMLSGDGGYTFKDGYWWNGGLTQSYYQEGFYQPWKTEGPGSGITALDYDKYWLCPVKITQFITGASSNISTAEIDYQTLQPKQITDINKNIAQALFDPLGLVTATSIYKTAGGKLQEGDGDLANYTRYDATFAEVLHDPHKFLQKATNYFFYDLYSWRDSGQPARSVSLSRETHVSQLDQDSETRVQIRIDFSDGWGRAVAAKVLTEPDPGGAGERWIVSGKTVYNNKGKPAMQYLPFFSATRDYENGEKISAGTPPPTKTFYDPLLRIIRIDTPKGFFSRVEFSPWVEKHYDENDTVLDSAFYNDFIKKGTSEQKFEEDTLKKARLFYNTPRQKVLDNTGKAFLTIETDVTADTAGNTQYIYLPTHSRLDIRGNLLAVTDPRLAKLAEPVQNLVQVFDLGNSILSSTSVDSGVRLTLNNIYGKPVHLWDGRGFHTATKYDSLQRPVEVRVTGDDGRGLVLDQVVESIVYGESQPDSEDKNLRGQVYQHSDQAGEQYFYRYDIHAKAVETGRRLRRDYKSEVDWSGSPALEDEIFKTNFVYNALVMPISNTAPDGAVHNRQYNISGFLNKISAAFDDKPGQGPPAAHNFIDSIAYNANNQRLSVYRDTRTTTAGCGRGVLTQYTYESTTLRLLKIITTRYTDGGQGGMKAAVLQNIDYTYDPVGNVTRIYDNAFDTVFCSQQVVEPLCDYTYNALYKLTRATGRQHPGILAGTHWDGFKESLYLPLCPPPNPNDAEKLENYSEFYSYDDAGNLLQTRHMAASAAWTREAAAAPDSNRLISVEGKKVDYDAAGNMLNLGFMRDVQWNYRNNISRADIILRPDENPDSDFYVYGSDGNRIRKVSERYLGNGVTEIEEKIYLGDFELKRVSRKTEAGVSTIFKRQSTHVTDDRKRIATTHYWLQDDFKRETDTPGERKFRYQYDNNLGSAILETDEKANIISYEEYSPYGETVLIAGNSQKEVSLKEYRYSGKERDDSTGLYYYGARYYISWLGRWMSPDPAGAIDGLNLYAFVGGNPLAFIDDKGNVKILIVGEGRSFEYAIRLAQKLSVPATSASSASASSTSTAPTNTVIVTQYDVSAPPQSVAWPQNLQLYRHKTGAKPGDKDFDVTDSGVWQTLAQKHGADFDAIIFNNPHAGFGQHKFQALGLTKGMLVTRMQAETIWYGGTMEVFREILKDLGEDFAFSKSGSLTDYATGTKYSFSELFQEVEGGYIAKRSIMGLNEFILSKFKFYGAQLLRAGGTLEVNMPANTATKIGAMGFVQTGFNWTTSPYYADYTSELTDQTYHPSFHETFQRTGPPRPATIGSMRRFVFTKQ